MFGCQNRKKPFKLSPGSTTSCDDGKLASSASTHHVSKVAKVGFHVEWRSIHIYMYLCDRSIVNRSSLITASWTNIVWILSQSSSNTTALLVHPIHALRACLAPLYYHICIGMCNQRSYKQNATKQVQIPEWKTIEMQLKMSEVYYGVDGKM